MINNYNDAQNVIEHAIAASIHATCCAVNHTMQSSPGKTVFQRDMFLDIPVIADLVAIRERRQLLIDENLRRQNRRRYEHHYKVGDYVWIKVMTLPRKMISSMILIKFKKQEKMELLWLLEMKKAMF